jgi:glycosyltransferase involved in cell wall biosynthesis
VFVVPDIAEDAELLSAQAALIGAPLRDPPSRVVPGRVSGLVRAFLRRRAPRRLLWFGNHGANYASFGIRDLLQFADGLRRVARIAPLEVTVVSNNEERYREVAAQLGVPSRYREWSETAVDDELAHADLCLVPNSGDEFSRTKSPNRALKALAAGVPVVATATPSYGPLLDCTWTGDPGEGIERLLLDGAVRRAQLYRARSVIARHYSLPVLRDAMLEVLAAIGLPRAARA